MKIKTKEMPYEEVLTQKPYVHLKPRKQSFLFRKLIKILSAVDLMRTRFTYESYGMEKLSKNQPCLILMNHSCFTDLEIIGYLFSKRSYHIVSTLDGMVGKKWLMRTIGCIPTKKFISDPSLVRDMVYAVKELRSSIVMFPEASYSFDGTATPLPDSLGKCLKLLGVPVVMVRTFGAFQRNPLYNCLQVRKTKVSARVDYILSADDIKNKTPEDLNTILNAHFSFDNFRWQQENAIRITEPFRADGLNRVLYRCPRCNTEGLMTGKGTVLSCAKCGKRYELTEYGYMKALEGETEFEHIPDWYQWERRCVCKELEEGTYRLDITVKIGVMVNDDGIYMVGDGRLKHSTDGFHLTGCEGKLDYRQSPLSSYGLYSDFYWYEIGDVICIGDSKIQYYCFPMNSGDVVAKTRLAAEELYKIAKNKK